jgi:hypothetical protein
VLNHERVAEVVADLCRAEVAAQAVHCGLRELERKHERGNVGLATLEVRAACPVTSTLVDSALLTWSPGSSPMFLLPCRHSL